MLMGFFREHATINTVINSLFGCWVSGRDIGSEAQCQEGQIEDFQFSCLIGRRAVLNFQYSKKRVFYVHEKAEKKFKKNN